MTLENANTVDAIGIENDSGFAVLSIIDTWPWDDAYSHLCALQEKLNAYFSFIETGQIWDVYPQAVGRQLVIDIMTRVPLPDTAHQFFRTASEVALQLNVLVRQQEFDDDILGEKKGSVTESERAKRGLKSEGTKGDAAEWHCRLL